MCHFQSSENWFLSRYALAGASLRSQVSRALPPDESSLKRTLRTHRMDERQRQKCHFFSEQAGNGTAERSQTRSPTEAFPKSKWWDTVGRLVSPFSLFLSSTHQSVGGGGAPIHRSTQQLHTLHQIMPRLPTRKLCDSYSLRRSHQTGSAYKRITVHVLRFFAFCCCKAVSSTNVKWTDCTKEGKTLNMM